MNRRRNNFHKRGKAKNEYKTKLDFYTGTTERKGKLSALFDAVYQSQDRLEPLLIMGGRGVIPGGHAFGVHRNDLLIKITDIVLEFLNDGWFKGAIPISWCLYPDFTKI